MNTSSVAAGSSGPPRIGAAAAMARPPSRSTITLLRPPASLSSHPSHPAPLTTPNQRPRCTASASRSGRNNNTSTTTSSKKANKPPSKPPRPTSARAAADLLSSSSSSSSYALDVLSALPRSAFSDNDDNTNNSFKQRARLLAAAARLLAPPASSAAADSRKRRRKEFALLERGRDPFALPNPTLEACVRSLERDLITETTTTTTTDRRALLRALLALSPEPAAGGPSPVARRHPRLISWALRGAAAEAVLEARRPVASSSSSSAPNPSPPPLAALRLAAALGVRDARALAALERALCRRSGGGDDNGLAAAAADAMGLFARLAYVPERLLAEVDARGGGLSSLPSLRSAARLAWGAAVARCCCHCGSENEATCRRVGLKALRAAVRMEEGQEEVREEEDEATTTTKARAQLHHARLLLLPPADEEEEAVVVPAALAQTWSAAAARDARPSTPTAAQQRVAGALARTPGPSSPSSPPDVLLEHPAGPEDSGVRVDVAVLGLGPSGTERRAAVEVDGPAHFLLEAKGVVAGGGGDEEEDGAPSSSSSFWRERPDGATLARTWLLRRWGWAVVRLKAREVDAAFGEGEDEEDDGGGGGAAAALVGAVVAAAAEAEAGARRRRGQGGESS